MSGKTDAFEMSILRLIFQSVPIVNIADNAVSAGLTSLWVSLHTADPGESGLQNTSETTYTGYARIGVVRSGVGWNVSTVSGVTSVNPITAVTFGECTAGAGTITHMGVGVASTGATLLLYSGPISPAISVGVGVQPSLSTSTKIIED